MDRDCIIQQYIKDKKLSHLPRKHAKRLIILEFLSNNFEFNKVYSEKEINTKIQEYNEDYCTIRREFIVNGIFSKNRKSEYVRLK